MRFQRGFLCRLNLATGEHILPWVRLNAIKDYWGMVALLEEFPRISVTFNLVPSMLVQLESFARDEARDRHLEIGLKPADTLTEEERTFAVVDNGVELPEGVTALNYRGSCKIPGALTFHVFETTKVAV